MEVRTAIEKRLSVRQYGDPSIPAEHLGVLLTALQLAPSANNSQNWEFVLVGDPELKKRLVPACFNQRFVAECAYFVAGIADPRLRWHMVDITIAMTQFTLQAVELGYGTCWIGAFEEDQIKQVLGVPADLKVVICLTFGKPKGKAVARRRKAPAEFVHLNGYGRRGVPQAKG